MKNMNMYKRMNTNMPALIKPKVDPIIKSKTSLNVILSGMFFRNFFLPSLIYMDAKGIENRTISPRPIVYIIIPAKMAPCKINMVRILRVAVV